MMSLPPLGSLVSGGTMERLSSSTGVVIACSGGADSLFLSLILHEWAKKTTIPLVICHVNHHTRLEQSDEDAKFVGDLGKEMSIQTKIIDVHPEKSDEGTLRLLRLKALKEVARENQCDMIALGQHKDDQAEGFLLAALRGSGVIGLSGMSEMRVVDGFVFLRPLLKLRKSEIVTHLKSMEREWREDASNQQGVYKRNFLRKEILPILEDRFPAVENLAKSAEVLQSTADDLRKYRALMLKYITIDQQEDYILTDRKLLAALPARLRVDLLRAIGRKMIRSSRKEQAGKLSEELVNHLAEQLLVATEDQEHVAETDINLHLSKKFLAVYTNDRTLFNVYTGSAKYLPWLIAVDAPSFNEAVKTDSVPVVLPGSIVVDRGAISGGLMVKPAIEGARIDVREGESQPTSKALKEAGVPSAIRPFVMAVFDDEGTVWIPGVRQSYRTLVRGKTKAMMRLQLIK